MMVINCKAVSATLLALLVILYAAMHVALNQRDDARKVTREQAIEQLCKGAFETELRQHLAEPAVEQVIQRPAERFRL